mmetsp:Transcript_31608/g.35926  ORF Transcript_31608/g.35926 Transcript_31608/m.35926 type:complete len:351 (-) Transcript_31608:222-1274(-)
MKPRALAIAFVLLIVATHATDLASYNIDLSKTTVSGISGGAYFATQMHFAFSSHIQGSAIFAGGPYLCALGTVQVALSSCMVAPWLIVNAALELGTKHLESKGLIDPLSNLKGDPVYIYSGKYDTVVFHDVVAKGEQMYENYGANVKTEYGIKSEHCYPTNNFGNSCAHFGKPFINDCDYNGAQEAFSVLFGDNLKAATVQKSGNLLSFTQNSFSSFRRNISLGDIGYVYVPTACQNGEACRLHISFHGCNQTLDDIGLDYVSKVGQNEIAEANNIIILYPQVKKSPVSPYNPMGCFDWWGYNNELIPFLPAGLGYASQKAPQMEAVWNMALHLAGQSSTIIERIEEFEF